MERLGREKLVTTRTMSPQEFRWEGAERWQTEGRRGHARTWGHAEKVPRVWILTGGSLWRTENRVQGREGEIARTASLEQAREDGTWCLRLAFAGHRRGLSHCFNFLTEASARPPAEGRTRGGNVALRPCTQRFGWFSQGCTERDMPPIPTDTLQHVICAAGPTAPSCQGPFSHPSSWAGGRAQERAPSSPFGLDPC